MDTKDESAMEKLVNGLSEGFKQMQDDVKEIKTFLLGSPFTEDKGHIHKVADHEERLTIIEAWKDYEIKTGAAKSQRSSNNIRLGLFIFAAVQAFQAIIVIAIFFFKK